MLTLVCTAHAALAIFPEQVGRELIRLHYKIVFVESGVRFLAIGHAFLILFLHFVLAVPMKQNSKTLFLEFFWISLAYACLQTGLKWCWSLSGKELNFLFRPKFSVRQAIYRLISSMDYGKHRFTNFNSILLRHNTVHSNCTSHCTHIHVIYIPDHLGGLVYLSFMLYDGVVF